MRGLLVGGAPVDVAHEGQEVEVVLDRTPFYAEGGGQLADAGRIELDGAVIEVRDVQSPITGLIVHRAQVISGEVKVGAAVRADVDVERRKAISRSHTATHMVHKAIREALGDTATQAGSENSPGRFRFDFHAASALPFSALRDVEDRVNTLLIEDLEVRAEVMTQARARELGAMALFGEKYGDQVRVVSVGTGPGAVRRHHTPRSGQIGMVRLLGEGPIGSGVRRVEAVVGADAYSYAAGEHVLIARLTETLKARPEELPERVSGLLTQLRETQKELDAMRAGQVLAVAATLAHAPAEVFGVQVVIHDAGEAGAEDLRALAVDVRGQLAAERPVVVAIGGVAKQRPVVVVATNEESRRWGVSAADLVRQAAGILGGGGGGFADLAQGGGSEPGRLAEALRRVEHAVGEKVTADR